MISKYSLRSLYSRTCGDQQMEFIEPLFLNTLHIRNANLSDLVTELQELRAQGCQDLKRAEGLYEYINGLKLESNALR